MSDILHPASPLGNDVYRQPELPADQRLIEDVDSAFVGFESVEQNGPHEFIRHIEADIENLRHNATEANLPKQTALERAREALARVVSSKGGPSTLLERLVEQESHIGGRLLKRPEAITAQRFWYYGGYWHYEETDAIGPAVVRYQVVDGYIRKLNGATELAFYKDEHIDERANILEMIQNYHATIRDEIYSNGEAL